VEQKIFDSNQRIQNITVKSSNISKMINNIYTDFEEIVNEVKKIRNIGDENIAHIQFLDSKIDSLKTE